MKRYFCVFVLLMLFLLTACKDDSLSVTSDGESVAASDLAAAGCVHEPVNDPRVEPTCTEPGQTEGTHCALCGEVLSGHTEIPAAGHMPETAELFDKVVCMSGMYTFSDAASTRAATQRLVESLGLSEDEVIPTLTSMTYDELSAACSEIARLWEEEVLPLMN